MFFGKKMHAKHTKRLSDICSKSYNSASPLPDFCSRTARTWGSASSAGVRSGFRKLLSRAKKMIINFNGCFLSSGDRGFSGLSLYISWIHPISISGSTRGPWLLQASPWFSCMRGKRRRQKTLAPRLVSSKILKGSYSRQTRKEESLHTTMKIRICTSRLRPSAKCLHWS